MGRSSIADNNGVRSPLACRSGRNVLELPFRLLDILASGDRLLCLPCGAGGPPSLLMGSTSSVPAKAGGLAVTCPASNGPRPSPRSPCSSSVNGLPLVIPILGELPPVRALKKDLKVEWLVRRRTNPSCPASRTSAFVPSPSPTPSLPASASSSSPTISCNVSQFVSPAPARPRRVVRPPEAEIDCSCSDRASYRDDKEPK